MVGPRDYSVRVVDFIWDFEPGRNVAHIARHGVRPEDVAEVFALKPRYFRNTQPHKATHVLVGPNRTGRYLRVAMIESIEPGLWVVATAHWLTQRRGERMYGSE